jgi:hypothetical protein
VATLHGKARWSFRVVACLCAAVPAIAQPLPTDRVYVEFTRPVRVPGTTLEAGQYLFVLGMPVGGQAVIDVYRGPDSRLIASCLAVESRMPPPGPNDDARIRGHDASSAARMVPSR